MGSLLSVVLIFIFTFMAIKYIINPEGSSGSGHSSLGTGLGARAGWALGEILGYVLVIAILIALAVAGVSAFRGFAATVVIPYWPDGMLVVGMLSGMQLFNAAGTILGTAGSMAAAVIVSFMPGIQLASPSARGLKELAQYAIGVIVILLANVLLTTLVNLVVGCIVSGVGFVHMLQAIGAPFAIGLGAILDGAAGLVVAKLAYDGFQSLKESDGLNALVVKLLLALGQCLFAFVGMYLIANGPTGWWLFTLIAFAVHQVLMTIRVQI